MTEFGRRLNILCCYDYYAYRSWSRNIE